MVYDFFFLMIRRPPRSTLLSLHDALPISLAVDQPQLRLQDLAVAILRQRRDQDVVLRSLEAGNTLQTQTDRKSTRLNSSHANISYAVFCLKKKNNTTTHAINAPP